MEWGEVINYVLTFILGGAAGSFLTIKVRNKSHTVNQSNIEIKNGDVVGRDKK